MIGEIRGREETSPPVFHAAACRVDWLAFHVIAVADTGIAGLTFSRAAHVRACERIIRGYPGARFSTNRRLDQEIVAAVSRYLQGRNPAVACSVSSLLLETGTPFQQRVWQYISGITPGTTRTYGELAVELGNPGSARAVGQACHANPLALIVPCHRVVGADGLGGFAGGAAIKRRLLRIEAALLFQNTIGPAPSETGATVSSSNRVGS